VTGVMAAAGLGVCGAWAIAAVPASRSAGNNDTDVFKSRRIDMCPPVCIGEY
jgi:uncharacterized membrane protein YadS